MRISPDGLHVLGGPVLVDGVRPSAIGDLHAGGWDWITEWLIGGYGGFDGPVERVGLYLCDLTTQRLTFAGGPSRLDSIRFHGGGGRCLSFNASGSWDCDGKHWPDLVAQYVSREGDYLFTNQGPNDEIHLVRRDGSGDVWHVGPVMDVRLDGGVILYTTPYGRDTALGAIGSPRPVSPVTGSGSAFCTRPDGQRFIASYVTVSNGLTIFPWVTFGPLVGWVLSRDGRDFNPDIAYRPSDGLIVVATGENQGETVQRLYEVEWDARRWRVNGGAWQSPVEVDLLSAAPPPPPIDPVDPHKPPPPPIDPWKPPPPPIDVPPHDPPKPLPEEIDMLALSPPILNVMLVDKIEPQSDGSFAFVKNGKYLELDSFGHWKEVDSVMGDGKYYRGKNGSWIAPNRGGHTHIIPAVETA